MFLVYLYDVICKPHKFPRGAMNTFSQILSCQIILNVKDDVVLSLFQLDILFDDYHNAI